MTLEECKIACNNIFPFYVTTKHKHVFKIVSQNYMGYEGLVFHDGNFIDGSHTWFPYVDMWELSEEQYKTNFLEVIDS